MNPDTEQKKDLLPVAAISALNEGKKIEAIKIVRLENHVDLKDAKDIVDQYLKAHPDLQVQIESHREEAGRRSAMWIITIIFISSCVFVLFL